MAPHEPLPPVVLSRLKHFSSMVKLKRVAVKVGDRFASTIAPSTDIRNTRCIKRFSSMVKPKHGP